MTRIIRGALRSKLNTHQRKQGGAVMEQDELDDILGITRCAQCGHRLEGEIECPFCQLFDEPRGKYLTPKWFFMAACFLTSPLSLYAIITTDRFDMIEKLLVSSGCLVWLGLYLFSVLR